MRSKLDELQKYSEDINKRVAEFERDIKNKELEINELKKEFSKAFIEGKNTDTKEMRKLEEELEDLKGQYALILQAVKEDEKMGQMSKAAYDEHYAYNDKVKDVTREHNKDIKTKELELKQLKDDLNNEILKIKQVQNKSKPERLEFVDYMGLNRAKRDEFVTDMKGQNYYTYKKNKLEAEGKTVEEINDFIRQDFEAIQEVK